MTRNHGWQFRRISSITRVTSGGTPSRGDLRFWAGGKIPWVTTSDVCGLEISDVGGRITEEGLANSSAKIFPPGTVIVAMYGQGKTRGQVGLLNVAAATNQACAALLPAEGLDPQFLFQYLNHSYKELRALSNSGGQANLSGQLVGHFRVPVPPLPEQRKIAAILRTWDDAIDKTLELRRLADARRAELAERILVSSHGVRRKLSEVTSPVRTRNSAAELGRESVMGVSNRRGLMPMREQTIAADISRYQVLPPRAFAYNPMRINVGSIAMSQSESDVLVSPDYVLFQCDERELRPEYLDHVLRTRWWLHHVNAGASGSVRTRTYYDDLAAISIAAPPIAEQDKVARAFDGLDREIELLQRKAELLRTQKRGLMQKLFTGQVRVNVTAGTEPGGLSDD